MEDWPELAARAYKHVCKNADFINILVRLETNALNLKPLLVKIDSIFDKAISTPNAIDRQGDFSESDKTIKRRFWILFFESLLYAVKKHSIPDEQHTKNKRSDYAKALQSAIEQADKLTKSLKIIAKYDKHSLGYDYFGGECDPLQWIMAALLKEQKNLNNPVFDGLEALQRFDNARYWPNADNVINSLSHELKNSLSTGEVKNKTRTPGILLELKLANWYRNTRYSWHLPDHFMVRLSDTELSLLISTGLGLENHLDKTSIRDAREAIGCKKIDF